VPLFLLKVWGWLRTKAWPWFKKYWMWVLLFPLALVIYLTGRSHGEVVVVNDDHESDAAKKKIADVETRAAAEREKAKSELLRKSAKVIEEHQEAVNDLTEEQEGKVDELLEDPDALNEYLLEVGRRARG
jgi:hypothetical protein